MLGIKRRARERVELREALAFYADPANWRRATGAGRAWSNSAVAHDRGCKARQAMGITPTKAMPASTPHKESTP